jgi:2-aminoadipate transaminase
LSSASTDTELATILAGPPPGVLSLAGGFPNPDTFPTTEIAEIVARLMRDDPGVALQYTAPEGIPSVREYMIERQERQQGLRPELAELMVTSGGMECIALVCHSLLAPGAVAAVEAPTYLGALMAFARAGAQVVGIPMDEHGLDVAAFGERLAGGLQPKVLYVIPEFQNPSGRTLPLARRQELVELCRRHGVLILEDVAYREIRFEGESLPSLWALAPDVVLQAGTFSKLLSPGVRLGWAAGPRDVIAGLAAAKQTTDQCAGALGQRIVEEYGRAGLFERGVPAARELYASHWRALDRALREHMPDGVTWSRPTGGFFCWLTLPPEMDTLALRTDALAAGVAYVPGSLFYTGDRPHPPPRHEARLSFSLLGEDDLEAAVVRLSTLF